MSGSEDDSDHRGNRGSKDRRHRSKDRKRSKSEGETAAAKEADDHGKGRANGSDETNNDKIDSEKIDSEKIDENLDPEERERRDKEERIAASLRKREEEVAKELSGHLHARDKEREQHRRSEAILAFQALLTDLIKHPDYSWKEAKKVFKKDSR